MRTFQAFVNLRSWSTSTGKLNGNRRQEVSDARLGSSTLTASTTKGRPANLALSFSIEGISSRHGSHQVAQKFTAPPSAIRCKIVDLALHILMTSRSFPTTPRLEFFRHGAATCRQHKTAASSVLSIDTPLMRMFRRPKNYCAPPHYAATQFVWEAPVRQYYAALISRAVS